MMRHDVAIVGAGIAGASLAAALADQARVVLLEAEDMPGRHATGRSAAFWSESYGGPLVQPLTTASGPWLGAPPPAYGGASFLTPRGALHLGRAADAAAMAALQQDFAAAGVTMAVADPAVIVPGLRPPWSEALIEPSCADIDVAALHAACLAVARRAGAAVMTDARLLAATSVADGWRLDTAAGPLTADILVNAAGAWADAVARLAGVRPIGITPYRRTIAQVRLAVPVPPTLPLVIDISGNFYFKPDAGGRLWLSPHDETPTIAGDAAPEALDVAIAIDRLEQVVDWPIEAVEHRWAGLRSFAPDRLPVYGFDPAAPGFFWCAGQGGFGIQTAPAAAMLAAALLLGRPLPPAVAAIDVDRYAAGRFSATAGAG